MLVVVAAALAAFLLGPFITEKWQNHERSVEVRTSVVGQMSDASAALMVAVLEREFHGDDSQKKKPANVAETKSSYIAHFRTWEVARQDIASRIGSYFGGKLETDWLQYTGILRTYYNLVDDSANPKRRKNDLARIESYTGEKYPLLATPKHRSEDDYQAQWKTLEDDLIARRSAIGKRLLNAHSSL